MTHNNRVPKYMYKYINKQHNKIFIVNIFNSLGYNTNNSDTVFK